MTRLRAEALQRAGADWTEKGSLPFKGRVGVGMGQFCAGPHPLLTSPLKGEEL
jgi:hypothetical protein